MKGRALERGLAAGYKISEWHARTRTRLRMMMACDNCPEFGAGCTGDSGKCESKYDSQILAPNAGILARF